jgi:hypothetical protein
VWCESAALTDYDSSIQLLWTCHGSWINPVPAVVEAYLQFVDPAWKWYLAPRGLDDFARYVGFADYNDLYGLKRSLDDRLRGRCWLSIKVDGNKFIHRLGQYWAEDELSDGPDAIERIHAYPENEIPKQEVMRSGAIIDPQNATVIYWPRNFNDGRLQQAWNGWRIEQVTSGDGWRRQASMTQAPVHGQLTPLRILCSGVKRFHDGIYFESDWPAFFELAEEWLSKMPCEFPHANKWAPEERSESFLAYYCAKSYFESSQEN